VPLAATLGRDMQALRLVAVALVAALAAWAVVHLAGQVLTTAPARVEPIELRPDLATTTTTATVAATTTTTAPPPVAVPTVPPRPEPPPGDGDDDGDDGDDGDDD